MTGTGGREAGRNGGPAGIHIPPSPSPSPSPRVIFFFCFVYDDANQGEEEEEDKPAVSKRDDAALRQDGSFASLRRQN